MEAIEAAVNWLIEARGRRVTAEQEEKAAREQVLGLFKTTGKRGFSSALGTVAMKMRSVYEPILPAMLEGELGPVEAGRFYRMVVDERKLLEMHPSLFAKLHTPAKETAYLEVVV